MRLNFLYVLAVSVIVVVITTMGLGLEQFLLLSLRTPLGSAAQGDELEKRAREIGDTLIPTCRFEGARCGYIDRNGNTVIAPRFDWADRFMGGRALVGIAGKYGAIDANGRLVVAVGYDSMSSFERGMALVVVGDQVGVIDQNGQWVVPAKHGAIVRISDDAFLVAEPPYSEGGGPLGPLSGSVPYAYGKRWGIVARDGRWVVLPTFAQVSVLSDDLNGLFWAADSAGSTARWQLMRADGSPVSNELFDHVQQIHPGEDRAVVERSGRWGAINGRGEIVVELKFDRLSYFRDGWAPYVLAGREGRIDRHGKILSDGVIQPTVVDPNAKLGALVAGTPLYTDQAGTTLLGTDHPKCPDGRHLRLRQGRWTIMSAAGKPAPDIAFQWVKLVCNGPSIVQHDDKWGFVSVDGELLAGRYFDRAHEFHGGIATIEENGLWAVIGEDGAVLLGPLKLARRMSMRGTGEHLMEFEEGDRTLDKALIAELARNPDVLTRPLAPRLPWSEGLAALLDDKTGKWGFIDSAQNFVITPQFDAVGRFTKGVAWAAFPERREWCRIDKAGRVVEWGRGCHCLQPLVEDHDLKALFQPDKVACYDYGIRIVRGIHETTR